MALQHDEPQAVGQGELGDLFFELLEILRGQRQSCRKQYHGGETQHITRLDSSFGKCTGPRDTKGIPGRIL